VRRVHVASVPAAEAERRDAGGERGVRVGRAVLEPVGEVELGADGADGGEQRVRTVEPAGGTAVDRLDLQLELVGDLERREARRRLLQLALVERTLLDDGLGVARNRVDRIPAGENADVDAVEPREQRDEAVDRARPAAVLPRVAAGSGHGEADADAADRVDDDAVEAVPLEGDRLLQRQRRRRVPRAAKRAQPFLTDGKNDGERRVHFVLELFDDIDRDRHRERVVADTGTDEPVLELVDLVGHPLAEDGVEVCEQREAVRRRAERPDQVAGVVPAQLAGRVREPPLEPEATPLLFAGRGRDPCERDRIPLDMCTNIRDDSCSFIGMSAVVNTIGSNLRRLRTERRLSLAELAARSRVAKATLANLEQGRGNPTIETLWALALGLDVAFSDLLEQSEEPEIEVVRAHDGVHVVSGPLDLRLLHRLHRGGLTEVFEFTLAGDHNGLPHGSGIVECVLVTSGRMRAGPARDPVELEPGDFVRYPADRAHVYSALEARCTGVLLVDYP